MSSSTLVFPVKLCRSVQSLARLFLSCREELFPRYSLQCCLFIISDKSLPSDCDSILNCSWFFFLSESTRFYKLLNFTFFPMIFWFFKIDCHWKSGNFVSSRIFTGNRGIFHLFYYHSRGIKRFFHRQLFFSLEDSWKSLTGVEIYHSIFAFSFFFLKKKRWITARWRSLGRVSAVAPPMTCHRHCRCPAVIIVFITASNRCHMPSSLCCMEIGRPILITLLRVQFIICLRRTGWEDFWLHAEFYCECDVHFLIRFNWIHLRLGKFIFNHVLCSKLFCSWNIIWFLQDLLAFSCGKCFESAWRCVSYQSINQSTDQPTHWRVIIFYVA